MRQNFFMLVDEQLNSLLTEREDITEWIWKIAVDTGSEVRYFDLLHGKVFVLESGFLAAFVLFHDTRLPLAVGARSQRL